MDERRRSNRSPRRRGGGVMEATKGYINDQLNTAQALLWGGSETENIEAHNLIASLINHLQAKEYN